MKSSTLILGVAIGAAGLWAFRRMIDRGLSGTGQPNVPPARPVPPRNDAAGPRLPALPSLPDLPGLPISAAVPNMPRMPVMPTMPRSTMPTPADGTGRTTMPTQIPDVWARGAGVEYLGGTWATLQ